MVSRLERDAFGRDMIRGLAMVGQIERDTAAILGNESPRGLPPVVMLHHELCRRYQLLSESPLTTHSWNLTADLAELTARTDTTPEAHSFAVETLVSLAGFLIDRSSSRQAASLLHRTLELDPSNAEALLGLAVILERTGKYQEALEPLERLTAAWPENLEGRLRLAINQARLGRRTTAARQLRSLTDASRPEWIRALAYQELARIELEQQRIAAASLVLEEAVQAIPSNQRLRIMLAYTFDQSRRPREAGRLIDGLQVQTDPGLGTPRLRYASWQPESAARARTELQRTAQARLGVLAGSLGRNGIEIPSRTSLAMDKVSSGLGGSLAPSLAPSPAAGRCPRVVSPGGSRGDRSHALPGAPPSDPPLDPPAQRTPDCRKTAL